MRPAEFPTEAIIEAGQALHAAGRNVTGFALRQKVGGGNPTRLKQVWDDHLAKAQPVVELPGDIADALAQVTKSLTEQLATLGTGLYARVKEDAQREIAVVKREAAEEVNEATSEVDRIEAERDAALAEVEVLKAKLAESQAQAQAQAVELAQLRERLSASGTELTHAREELTQARDQAAEAREEAARLRGQVEAIEGQRAELVKVLAERPGEKGAGKGTK
jgi:colicin import membrane protein